MIGSKSCFLIEGKKSSPADLYLTSRQRSAETMSKNKTLSDAKSTKNDEFYTQYADIQKKVNA
jgi:hypothetical protein